MKKEEISAAEAARLVGVTNSAVSQWISAGKLEGMYRTEKQGLFRTLYFIDKKKYLKWIKDNS